MTFIHSFIHNIDLLFFNLICHFYAYGNSNIFND